MTEAAEEKVVEAEGTEEESLRAELARIQAKRAALQQRSETQEAKSAVKRKVAEEARALEREEAIAKGEAELGQLDIDFAVLDTPTGCVVLKQANHMHYKQWQDAGKTSAVACDTLVRKCLFYPEPTKFDALTERYGGLVYRCATAIHELAMGRRKDAEAKS